MELLRFFPPIGPTPQVPYGRRDTGGEEETSSAGKKQSTADEPRNVTVYFKKGMFGGWPANHGIWSWSNEILVGWGALIFISETLQASPLWGQ